MSIEQIGPKSWTIRVQWRDPKTGLKRGTQEQFQGTKREAAAREAELRAESKGSRARSERLRLETYARSWLASRALRTKPSTSSRYASALDLHVLPALGQHYVDKLERDDVQQYVAARVAAGAQGHTVLNELRVLRMMARDAHADGICDRNWADRVTPPRVRKWTEDRPNLLSAPQLGALLGTVPKQWLAAVMTSAYTGLRWGELAGLRWGDIDEKAGTIKVRRSNWRGRMDDPKNQSSRRTVALPPPVVALLRASGRGKPAELVFPNRSGKAHKGWPLVKVMKRACKAAEVPYTTPHGLRRTFNNLSRQVTTALVVKAMTGHATDAMMEHYSLVSIDEKAKAVRGVIALVSGSSDEEVEDGAEVERQGDSEDRPECRFPE